MKQYLNLIHLVLENGEKKDDRTGMGIISLFGTQTRYDLREGFPLLTTKKVLFPAVVRELLWFLSGSTNINEGLKEFTPIWNAWADEEGELGPIYGWQWRRFGENYQWYVSRGDDFRITGIDQIQSLISEIKNNPTSRRHLVTAWNPLDLDLQTLPPCHILFQCNVGFKEETPTFLDLQLYQRSADLALGVPFNIASYALLQSMIAQVCGLVPRFFIHSIGDAHIYLNHVEGLKRQLEREPRELPKLKLAAKRSIDDFRFKDVSIEGYDPHPFIKFEVAV